jgi:Domain of unknown function (DUF4167)
MRPQQQNRRMRGRSNNNNSNNNNRKGPNPLTRNYESNGPDVKIRGSAQQIAEKYTTLARDSHSSGDRVMAENYLQHAEHYNRIIAAAQAQMPIQNMRDSRDDLDDDAEDDLDNGGMGNGSVNETVSQPMNNGSGPQPVIEGTPAEVALNHEALAQRGGEQRERPISGGPVDGEDGQRRSRRPRRGRGRPEQEGLVEASSASEGDTGTAESETPDGQSDTSLANADN